MDNLLVLFRQFKKHATRFLLQEVDDMITKFLETPECLGIEELIISNLRHQFSVKLLKVLQNELDDADIELLSSSEREELFQAFRDLFKTLDQIANEDFAPTTDISNSTWGPQDPPIIYTKFVRLLTKIERTVGHVELASDAHSSLFLIDTDNGRRVISCLEKINNDLVYIQGWSFAEHIKPKQNSIDSSILRFVNEYLNSVDNLLNTIHREFAKCNSSEHSTTHKIMIHTADIANLKHPCSISEVDAYLQCPGLNTWQQTQCKLIMDDRPWVQLKWGLCRALEDSFDHDESLYICFHSHKKTFSDNFKTYTPPTNISSGVPWNLESLMVKDSMFDPSPGLDQPHDPFRRSERRTLAAKIALNILIFSTSKHTSKAWDSKEVYFVAVPKMHYVDYNIGSPYISCLLCDNSENIFSPEKEDPEEDHKRRRDQEKCFTKLASLLLEIENGPLPPSAEDKTWKSVRRLHDRLKAREDLSSDSYLDAVNACLRFSQLYKEARNSALGRFETSEETWRRCIYTNILERILVDLPGFSQVPENKGEISTLGLERGKLVKYRTGHELSMNTHPFQPRYSTVTEPSHILPEPTNLQGTQRYQNGITTYPETTSGSLFDSQSTSQRPSTASLAERWLTRLKKDVHPIIQTLRRSRDRRVKVAVLDTGIDREHPLIETHCGLNKSSIQIWKNWVQHTNGVLNPDDIHDNVGHGTAVCDILLQIAKVDLCVGKISDSAEFDNDTPKRVAEGIIHATMKWKVDIIVLSLGFKDRDDDIEQAIKSAADKNIIILAAASNSGSVIPDKMVKYPARLQGFVLSIRSATGDGKISDSSPESTGGDDNYMILGEGILAAWPTYLDPENGSRYVSGSSFANATAAGVLALALEFSIQKDESGYLISERNRKRLWSHSGAREIFREMSQYRERSGNGSLCNMVSPWKLFSAWKEREGLSYYRSKIERLMDDI